MVLNRLRPNDNWFKQQRGGAALFDFIHLNPYHVRLLLAVFVDLFGVALVVPLLPKVFKDLGGRAELWGAIASSYSIAQIVGGVLLGGISVSFYHIYYLLINHLSLCVGSLRPACRVAPLYGGLRLLLRSRRTVDGGKVAAFPGDRHWLASRLKGDCRPCQANDDALNRARGGSHPRD